MLVGDVYLKNMESVSEVPIMGTSGFDIDLGKLLKWGRLTR